MTRVFREVLLWAELCGVDKNRRHDKVGLVPRGLNQAEVTGVQRAHRRYEAHARPALLRMPDDASHLGNLFGDHQRRPTVGLRGGHVGKATLNSGGKVTRGLKAQF